MEIAIIPQYLIRYISSDYYKQNDFNILISNLLILLVFIFFGNPLLSILNALPHFCLIDKVTGIECPVCGTTRAFCELSSGNLQSAFSLNRTSILVAIYFVFQVPLRIASILNITDTKRVNNLSKYSSSAILTLILINWIIKLFTNQL